MPVTSTNVKSGPRVQKSGQHRGTIEFVFHNGDKTNRNVNAVDETAWLAKPADLTPDVEDSMEGSEVSTHKASLQKSLDPYFNDMGGWYEKKDDFAHTTWDDSFAENIKYYLSLELMDTLHIKESIDRISNTDLKNVLDISQKQATKIRSDIQIAVNLQAEMDGYAPLFNEEGELIE